MTRTIWTIFRSGVLRSLHMKFEFNWPSGFRGEDVWKCWRTYGCRSDWYTISSPMSLRLRWAKNIQLTESINSTKQIVHAGCQYSKICLKQPLKKGNTKILIKIGSLMKVERIAECSPWSILQYFWPALNDNWSSYFSGGLRQVLLYNQQSIYIYACKCLSHCVGKVYYQIVNCG